jgi:ligand-binding sensor domain-containing protein
VTAAPYRFALAVAALLFGLTLVRPGDSAAQPSSLPVSRELPPTAAFTHLTVEGGLADQVSAEITQDAEGFMWFGTFSGLDRYDGYRFVHYRHDDADEHSLSGNVITALYTDRSGNVWVGACGAGINRFDPRTQQFQRFQHDAADPVSLSSDSPRMIYQDTSGVIWIASEGGLSHLNADGDSFTNYRHDDADPSTSGSNSVRSIAEDATGTLWLGTSNGLSRFDRATGQFTTYRHDAGDPQSLGSNALYKVIVDHLGIVWMATDNGLDSSTRAASASPTIEMIHRTRIASARMHSTP